jgi:putative hydrolase of the HAD superfamily
VADTEPRRFAAVIFDLYATLVDFSARRLEQTIADVAALLDLAHADYVAANAGKRADWEAGVYDTLESHFDDIYAVVGASRSPERIQAAAARYLEFARLGLTPRADAVETLTWLRANGYRTGLISNCSTEVPLVWPDSPLAALIDAAVFSCRERLRKPDPRIYLRACERLQVAPTSCLYVGDGGAQELTGAAAVGMHAVQICVPDEDPYDAAMLGRQAWSGPRISRLSEVISCIADTGDNSDADLGDRRSRPGSE